LATDQKRNTVLKYITRTPKDKQQKKEWFFVLLLLYY
jgi:hypothetical protein